MMPDLNKMFVSDDMGVKVLKVFFVEAVAQLGGEVRITKAARDKAHLSMVFRIEADDPDTIICRLVDRCSELSRN